ncbi:hypothetical protein SELMODRAFT_420073 [Selaginella moellendorffii]|uniref:Uncharacterized protein n=1 Tax=Selaginella moellendorffii TaxID=88036 RepID=D8SAG4_SELML|nr:hypothetical protein SELMODRAFT_420073 [Selaginella moellendorffii]
MLEVALIYYSIALYGLSNVEEDEVDGLPYNFSDLYCGSNMDSNNDALPEAFYNFLQLRGFSSPAAFGTWMHLKILETKTIAYLACYFRISKPTLYKYMWLVDSNWRGAYYRVPPEEHIASLLFIDLEGPSASGAIMLQSTMRLRGIWSAVGVLQLRASYVGHQHEFLIYLIHITTKVYVVSLLHTSRRIFYIGLQPKTSTRIMTAVGGKNIEDLSRPFLSNVEGSWHYLKPGIFYASGGTQLG